MGSTCVVVGAVGALVLVVVSVLGGEHHSAVVGHGVGQIPGRVRQVDGVVAVGTLQGEGVLDLAFALFPVLQLDVEEGVSLSGQRVDPSQAQPELPWSTRRKAHTSTLSLGGHAPLKHTHTLGQTLIGLAWNASALCQFPTDPALP